MLYIKQSLYVTNIDITICPICLEGIDNQEHNFQCRKITEEVKINPNIQEVYSDTISQETAKTISKIITTRQRLISNA